mmetsp:Transcript_32452/g.56117  ORF Transcript_32452/g.56117 Transcript_32452/m.56117 type:complete len:345 (-) Transcript_32452:391-1425(-)
MDQRPAEADAFMVELLKRKRNLNKQLEKISQAELKASQGQKLVDEQIKKLANKARYEEQLNDVEGWINLYTRTHGVKLPEKPKPVVVVEAPKVPEKPDTRVPDILILWLTGSYLAEEQVKAKYDSEKVSNIVLGEFLAFWHHVQGNENEVYEEVAGRAQTLLHKYLEGSDELAPQTTRSFAEIKQFVEESAVWLQSVQRPVAEVVQPHVVADEIVVTTPFFSSLVESKPETHGWEETPAQEEEVKAEEVHEAEEAEPEAPQELKEEEEPKRGGWADEEEEEAHEEAKAEAQQSEDSDFITFTKKKKQHPAPPTRGRPRGQRSNRGTRRPRGGKFPAQTGKPGPQ